MTDISDWETFITGGIQVESAILRAGQDVREKSKIAYGPDLLEARLSLLAIAWHLLNAKAGVPGQTNPSVSERITLIMTFFQGVPTVESMISEGQYIKAAALLKQDYETLTRIREVKKSVARPHTTPNVRNAPEGSQRFYGELNDVAHPSSLLHLRSLLYEHNDGPIRGVSCLPTFVSHTAHSFYSLHVWLLLELTREYILLMAEMYPDDGCVTKAVIAFEFPTECVCRAGFVVTGPEAVRRSAGD